MASITKRGKGYRIKVSLGYDLNNHQIVRYRTWTPPAGMSESKAAKEVQRQAVLFEEECKRGRVVSGSTKFAEFIRIWLDEYAAVQLRPTTVGWYQQLFKRIIPALGHLRIDRIQPHHLQAFYNNLAETGVRDDGKQRFKGDFDAVRKEKGWSLSDVAARSGVSVTTIRQIAAGKNVTMETAEKVSSCFDRPVSDLFEPVAAGAVLSSTSINQYHKAISAVLSTAVQWGYITDNPCNRIKPPKVQRKEGVCLDDRQTEQLIDLLDTMPESKFDFRVAYTVLLFTGLRRSELLGLRWRDIDLDTGVLSVCQTTKYIAGQGIIFDDTKNTSSFRSLKMPSDLIPLLKRYKAWQNARRLRMGDRWEDNGLLFTNDFGAPMRPDTLSSNFHRLISGSGLPDIHLHSLRHTNATLLIANGTNVQTVAKRLGHSSANTTMKVYAHAIQAADAAAAESVPLFHTSRKKDKEGAG